MPAVKPLILAYKKAEIDLEFKEFLQKYQPLGLIITQESCHNPVQLQRFVNDFRNCVGREDAVVSIDQEGGRGQRLAGRVLFDQGHLVLKTHPGSKHWPYYPEASLIGQIYQQDRQLGVQVSLQAGRAIGAVLASLNIDLNYAPVIDIPLPNADPIISDRAYSSDPHAVAVLAREFITGLHQFGVKSCIKHLPGHGRAKVDSHKALPVISATRSELEEFDFLPFRSLQDVPWLMAGHMLFDVLDPQRPASQSKYILQTLLREEFGFSGVICSDCIWMEALKGSLPERAVRSQNAGCDVVIAVHGNLAEQAAILEAMAPIGDTSLERLAKANRQVSAWNNGSTGSTGSKVADWQGEYQTLQRLMLEAGCQLQAPAVVGNI